MRDRAYLLIAVAAAALAMQAAADDYTVEPPYCQILDGTRTPVYRVALGYTTAERFEGYDRSGLLELDADWQGAYFRDILWGNIDTAFGLRTALILDSVGLQLPDQLVGLWLRGRWTLRTIEGTAFRVGARPGLYSDAEELSGDGLYVPFHLAAIQSFSPELSGIVGVEVRPGFDREFFPIAALAWQPSPLVRVEVGVPESRLEWSVAQYWTAHAGFLWNNETFALREKGDYDRQSITVEDYTGSVGVSYAVSDSVSIRFDLGRRWHRSVSFEKPADGLAQDVDIDEGTFVRLAAVGPF